MLVTVNRKSTSKWAPSRWPPASKDGYYHLPKRVGLLYFMALCFCLFGRAANGAGPDVAGASARALAALVRLDVDAHDPLRP